MSPSPNPFADDPLPEANRLKSAADPLNPYASPVNADPVVRPEKVGVWRDGPLLVMHRRAKLPEVCVVTGEPTQQRHWETVRWTQPVDFGDRALVVEYGIQPSILRERNRLPYRSILSSVAVWIGVLGTTAFIVKNSEMGAHEADGVFNLAVIIGGILTAICFLPYLISRRRNKCVRLAHVDKYYVWLSGPSEALLRTLPPWTETNRGV